MPDETDNVETAIQIDLSAYICYFMPVNGSQWSNKRNQSLLLSCFYRILPVRAYSFIAFVSLPQDPRNIFSCAQPRGFGMQISCFRTFEVSAIYRLCAFAFQTSHVARNAPFVRNRDADGHMYRIGTPSPFRYLHISAFPRLITRQRTNITAKQ